MKLEIFDPPMCCATGVCGTDVDPSCRSLLLISNG
ncbi:MAG: arsenic metallochaperone ArsD family protein [Acidobacteriota bacterium]